MPDISGTSLSIKNIASWTPRIGSTGTELAMAEDVLISKLFSVTRDLLPNVSSSTHKTDNTTRRSL